MTTPAAQAPPRPPVCDSCLTFAHDQTGADLDLHTTADFLSARGADLPDHICDSEETGQDCICACNSLY